MELNILFLAPNWRAALIKSFRDAAGRAGLKAKLAGADSDPYSPAQHVLDPAVTVPPFTDPECLAKLLWLCKEESIQAVIPLSNKAVEYIDANRAQFQESARLLYAPSPAAIATCHDKLKLAGFLTAAGVKTPLTLSRQDLERQRPHFPFIAKKRAGEGGKERFIVKDQRDLDYCLDKYPDHIFQEFISGKEYTIDWFADRDGTPLLIVPRERMVVRDGEVWVSRITMNPRLIDAARTLGTRLGLCGPCNLQGILDPVTEQFYFTDVNLRFGSGTVHTIAAGGNIPLMIYKEILGQPPAAALGPIRDGAILTRYHDSYQIS